MGIPLQPYSVGPTYSGVWLGVMPYYGLITLRPYSVIFAAFYSGRKGQFSCVLGCPDSFFPVLPSQPESHLHLHPLPPDFFRPHCFRAGTRALS
ncbi:hypothetical protein Gogos_018230, partial [Gossypium gossypioides]|nr:hypothetical protein [Gossypium gossypioides]